MSLSFLKFLSQREHGEYFITGPAGTGKTTDLRNKVQECIDAKIKYVACAYTHKACGVLKSKLQPNANVCTLHSFLSKRPTINDQAKKVEHVDGNAQVGKPDEDVQVLFVDEFSMVGERDYADIQALMYDEDGEVRMHVVYIGDVNQLPPVKDVAGVRPKGPYWEKLTKIYRQANDNPLINTLLELNDFINGKEASPLREHSHLKRGQDIAQLYKNCVTSKILLAYTNERVQELNAQVQGYDKPVWQDELFCPNNRRNYVLVHDEDKSNFCVGGFGREQLLELGSKYKTLETIHEIEGVRFYHLMDEDGHEACRAAVFGHKDYLRIQEGLAKRAVHCNNKVEAQSGGKSAKEWARENWSHPLAKERAKAWARYLAFKDFVFCLDFRHAMTVHKSQGSTYENVFLDMKDMGRCADNDYQLYLKLLYVAVSRASDKVYTN